MRLQRRDFLIGAAGFAGVACSSNVKGGDTYTVVDAFDEIAVASDGSRCAVQKTSLGINTILLTRGDLSEPSLLSLPNGNWLIRDLAFGADAQSLLFSAGPPQSGGFDMDIDLYQLDLRSLQARLVPTGLDYNRAPASSHDGAQLVFAGRPAGGSSLLVHRIDSGGEPASLYSSEQFDLLEGLAFLSEGNLVVHGRPGRDPFDGLRIDEANGFQRVFLLGGEGPPNPAPFAAIGADALHLAGRHRDEVLLIAINYSPSGTGASRLVMVNPVTGASRFVDMPQLEGLIVTGAAVASASGVVIARAVNLTRSQDVLAVQGLPTSSIRDLASRAQPVRISL